jgi:hypothetical protein
MKGWTGPADIRARVKREWERGRILAATLGGEAVFPMRVPLRGPDAKGLSDGFEEARRWIAALQDSSRESSGKGYVLEWREINHRQLGRNRVPVAALINSEEDGLALIGRHGDAARFRELAAQVSQELPPLTSWLVRRPLRALELADAWPRLLGVVKRIAAQPRPGIYLRQLDVPGVDTKFIERHKGVLSELLDLALPAGAVDPAATGASSFERRYGFRAKPALVRFRVLDPRIFPHGAADLSIPSEEFVALSLPARRVFITENEINGLAFPAVPDSIVIFGLGYGLDRLAAADWLHACALWYWGDIDTHGFAILDRLRCHFPAAYSLLMDRATLVAHRALWGREETPLTRDLPRLDPQEMALFDELRTNRIAPALRLEQERISYGWLQRALAGVAVQRSLSGKRAEGE